MKRPRKFYRDKELRRRVKEADAFDRREYYLKQDGYVTVFTLSKEAKKHALYHALVEILPLITIKCWHRTKPEEVEFKPIGISRSTYVKLKPEHKACFERGDKHFDGYTPLLRRRSKTEKQEEPYYYLLSNLKDFIIPVTHKHYCKYSTWIPNPLEPSLDRNHIREKAAKIFDGMSFDGWWDNPGRELKIKDIQRDVRKEVQDLT